MSNFTQTQPDIYLEQEKILAIGCLSVMLGKDTLYFSALQLISLIIKNYRIRF